MRNGAGSDISADTADKPTQLRPLASVGLVHSAPWHNTFTCIATARPASILHTSRTMRRSALRRLLSCTHSRTPPVQSAASPARCFNSPSVVPPLRHPPFSPISRPMPTYSNVYSSTLKSIGNTPLVKLKKASELTGCNIYGKVSEHTFRHMHHTRSLSSAAAMDDDADVREAEEPGH